MALVKSPQEIEILREGGSILAEALSLAESLVRPGISTREINDAIESLISSRDAYPAFKGLNGFPAAACISVNEEVVHGIPGNRVLESGDIVGIDVGVRYQGLFTDAARTFPVGEVGDEVQRLLTVTEEAMYAGIRSAAAGNWVQDISRSIQEKVERAGYHVVRVLVGHGVGHHPHEEPQIPNYVGPFRGKRLKERMVLAIEPMVNVGTAHVKTLSDGWTVVTADRSLSAHFENTVWVTETGGEILTGDSGHHK